MAEVANVLIVWLLILGALRLTSATTNDMESSSASKGALPRYGRTPNSFVLDMMHIHHEDLSYVPANVTLLERIQHSMRSDEERLRYLTNQIQRINAIFGTEKTYSSEIYSAKGIYITDIYIGTPPRRQRVGVDTGSSLVWVQCEPCENTLHQREPVFDPRPPHSSTYSNMPYDDPYCADLSPDIRSARSVDNKCLLLAKFAMKLSAAGNFAYEALTFSKVGDNPANDTIPKFPFGCVHSVSGTLNRAGGALGLGRSSFSLIAQMKKAFSITIFSYCLVEYTAQRSKTTPLLLGPAPIRVPNVQYTPIIHHPKSKHFYYLIMTGISVDGNRLNYAPGLFDLKDDVGGVMIDPGVTASAFNTEIYKPYRDAVAHSMRTLGYPSVQNPSAYKFAPCYSTLAMDIVNQRPKVTFHFQNLDLELPFINVFLEVSAALYCFAISETKAPFINVIGAVQQQNTDISYDIRLNRLGIAPKKC